MTGIEPHDKNAFQEVIEMIKEARKKLLRLSIMS
jgi:hypothetical protein